MGVGSAVILNGFVILKLWLVDNKLLLIKIRFILTTWSAVYSVTRTDKGGISYVERGEETEEGLLFTTRFRRFQSWKKIPENGS